MGFLEKLRAELVDIVEWMDDGHDAVVWRFPRYHNQIKYGAQLIVRPGQQAVFVHQGRIADIFEPGQYTLETRNLPILSTLAGWKHGFDSPFKAEVYFVRTTEVTDLKWGTPNPVMMRDPDFGPVRVRAFGGYTLKATDPRALMEALVGTDQRFDTDEVTELLRTIVASAFADVVASAELAVLDLASNYAALAEKVRRTAVTRIDDEYGLDLPQLLIVNISLPEEVERALDKRSSMGVIGDMQAYQAYQLGTAMPAAAENPAGGIAGAGMGVGMGMAVARGMTPGAGGGGGPASPPGPGAAQAPTAGTAAVPPPPPPGAWHIAEAGRAVGPFSTPQLVEAVRGGRVQPDTLVWTAGMPAWRAAAEHPELAGLFRGATPPPVPPGAA